MQVLGIDVGGSGIKGAIVDSISGQMLSERHRIATPQPATPEAVGQTIAQMVQHFDWQGPIGIGFPAAIVGGVCKTASNIDHSFIGVPVNELFSRITGQPCFVANDADVAGLAEMKFGQGQGENGVVIVVTLGTGIGTAMFSQGRLVPNMELGHIYMEDGTLGEAYAADSARKRDDLGWKKWGRRVNKYLNRLHFLTHASLILIGGGASKKIEKFASELDVPCPVRAAELENQAGIVGAAMYALECQSK